ncbi:Inosine-uridine preferring nucleoside hydrolase [Paenibacillus pasadenensis]|uniref:Inosine-uridine preferring nucleoside hydrolase n=2 Tax=Paenibacillus pasadenensis TaxID=217090 RepID=A0A2N5N009_9BACL|nr:Inosine-uridine preferring nucleoside hydrolase [Paenibacillus pasadenensis]
MTGRRWTVMSRYPKVEEAFRLERLAAPQGRARMVLDTDTFNEIDDQFALAYALLSPEKVSLEAVYAAPFFNELSSGPKDGMEKSYEEIERILSRFGLPTDGYAFRGSERYLPGAEEPVDSPAARDLVARAQAMPDDEPLYVVAIGAVTNVASAILLEPSILRKIVVVWLGGHALHWPDANEFNLQQDVHAVRVLLDSGVPFVLVPCMGVASQLLTTLPEVNERVRGRGAIGDFLAERYESCSDDHFGRSRVIWDLSAVAFLAQPQAVWSHIVHSPLLTDNVTWSFNSSRHLIRSAYFIDRDAVFRDFYAKLDDYAAGQRTLSAVQRA